MGRWSGEEERCGKAHGEGVPWGPVGSCVDWLRFERAGGSAWDDGGVLRREVIVAPGQAGGKRTHSYRDGEDLKSQSAFCSSGHEQFSDPARFPLMTASC